MTRHLEIIFYGLACFHYKDDGTLGVLFPDGRNTSNIGDVDAHTAALWVRGREAIATARWPWPASRNDFEIQEPSTLEIHGLKPTPLNVGDLRDHLPRLTDADPAFKLSPQPDTILKMTVDRGSLTAHVLGKGMILTRWGVEADGDAPIKFACGQYSLVLAPDTHQVMIANVALNGDTGSNHFRIYRKLGTNQEGDLEVPDRRLAAQSGGLNLDDPSDGYSEKVLTPRIPCSNAFDK
ncbi:MAG TPA: hypothetical protein VF701_16560 [Thermoanaerobaculia bacterium]